MRITPRDRLDFKRDLADTRLDSRLGHLLIPTLVRDPSFDSDTQTGADVSSGNGTGVTVAWKVYAFHANFRNIDSNLIAFGHVPPGLVLGDSFFSIDLRDETVFKEAYANEHAYCCVDGKSYRIVGSNSAGVGQVEELIIGLKPFNPVHRAAGY